MKDIILPSNVQEVTSLKLPIELVQAYVAQIARDEQAREYHERLDGISCVVQNTYP
jgi:hypothetical protein